MSEFSHARSGFHLPPQDHFPSLLGSKLWHSQTSPFQYLNTLRWFIPFLPLFACKVNSYLSSRTQLRFDFLFDMVPGYPFPRDHFLCTPGSVHTSVLGLLIPGAITSEVTEQARGNFKVMTTSGASGKLKNNYSLCFQRKRNRISK